MRNHSRTGVAAAVAPLLWLSGCARSSAGSDQVTTTTAALNGTINYTFDGPICTATAPQFRANFDAAFTQYLVPIVVTNPAPLVTCLGDAIFSGEIRFGAPSQRHADVRWPEFVAGELAENVPTNIRCGDTLVNCGSGGGENFACPPGAATIPVIDLAGLSIHEIAHKTHDHPGPLEVLLLGVNDHAAECVRALARGAVPPAPFGMRRSQLTSPEMTLAQVGGEGGGPKIPAHCGANEVMSGFWGLWSPGDGVVQLNGTCKSLSTSNTALLLGSGGFSGSSFQDDCAGGEIAVGASGSADLGLRSIGAICAAQTTVQNGGSASTPHVPAGSSSGIAWQRRCPPFHALKGFRLRSGDTVDRLELVCQDVRDGRNIDQSLLQRAGLTGEYRYIETCQSRAVMTGMMTSTNSEVTPEIAVRRLGGWCANVWDAPFPMPFEPINDGRHVLPTHGGTSLNQPPNWIEAVDRCPAGQALIGLTAHSSLGIFAGIQGKCAEVEAWSNGAAGPTSDLPFRGRTTIPVPRMCPSRNFMVGWSIDTDTTVHGVRPICRKFSNTGGVAIASEIFDGALSTLSSILM